MKINTGLSKNIGNVTYNGRGNISGKLQAFVNNILMPIPKTEVFLFNQKNSSYIDNIIYSDKDGHYKINNIDLKNNTFFIIVHDKNKKFNGIIADNIGGADNVDG